MEVVAIDRVDDKTAIVKVKWKDATTNEWIAVLVRVAATPDEIGYPKVIRGSSMKKAPSIPAGIRLVAISKAQAVAGKFARLDSKVLELG